MDGHTVDVEELEIIMNGKRKAMTDRLSGDKKTIMATGFGDYMEGSALAAVRRKAAATSENRKIKSSMNSVTH